MREDYDLVGSYDNQRVSTINAERTVNLFEYMDADGKRPKVLLPTAGLVDAELNFGLETGGARASFVFDDAIYQVYGSTVYRTTGSTDLLSTIPIGTLTTIDGYVGIDANTFQVIFVDGELGYIWDTNALTFTQITDTSFPASPIDVCYLDGFFLVANGDTNTFQLSLINQGMVWGGGSATYTVYTATDIITLSTNNANFATGVPVTVTGSQGNATFTSDFITDIITLSTSNASYQVATPVTLTTSGGTATFTADATTDILTLSKSNTNFQTGSSIVFTTTGTLPNPLVVVTVYYVIGVGSPTLSPGTIKVATSYANAIAGIAINLTTNGGPVNTVTSSSILPAPLLASTTYYTIPVSASNVTPGTVKLATTAALAIAGTAINLTDNGAPVNTMVSTSTLPAPLALSTTYYAIRVSSVTTNPGTIKLATSYANAIAGVAIDFTSAGISVNTITVAGQLQLGSITSHPGTIVGCRTLHRRIFLFSQNFTEVWENAGLGTNLPFRRNNSLLMEVGTPALGSIVVGFDRMFFLAQDKDGLAGVMEVKGTESILVSNRALDFQLAQYAADPLTGVADARSILIKENGLIFFRLNFTLANHTFVLNVTMSTADAPKWHEEEVLNGDRHPAQTHAYFDGVNYYGDYSRPLFYVVADGVSTNNGETIRRMRIGRQMAPPGYNRLRIDRFQVDLLQGALDIEQFIDVELTAEDGDIITTESSDDLITENQINIGGGQPTVFLAISKDGGQTYGNYIHATMGKIGERTHRTVWRKLGTTPRGQGYVPKIEFFNEIPFVVLGAAWDYEVLPE